MRRPLHQRFNLRRHLLLPLLLHFPEFESKGQAETVDFLAKERHPDGGTRDEQEATP